MSSNEHRTLGFSKPRGLPVGPILAILLTGGLVGWMSSGSTEPDTSASGPVMSEGPSAQSVRTVQSSAAPTSRTISAKGETQAERKAGVTSKLSGTVSELLSSKGDDLKAGAVIAVLEVPDFAARKAEASAKLAEAQRTLEKTESLEAKGLSTRDALGTARTAFATAQATWARISEEQVDMTVRAPFSGRLNSLDVEIGDNVPAGGRVGEILDLDRLIVNITIPQADIAQVTLGQKVTVKVVTGEALPGMVTFISAAANPATRSFPVEITIDNPQSTVRAGLSATVSLTGKKVEAHSIATAFLSLAEDGRLTVKVAEDGVVNAYPVEIISSTIDTVQVTGLPQKADIITVGQGFVRHGDLIVTETDQ